MQDYREVVRAALSRRGWSIRRLARESGVPHATIADWLRVPPESDMHTATLARLAHALGLELRPGERAGR